MKTVHPIESRSEARATATQALGLAEASMQHPSNGNRKFHLDVFTPTHIQALRYG